MISIDDRVKSGYDFSVLEKIHTLLSDREVEFIITDDDEIKELNAQYRGIDKSTDVLSFPLEEIPFMPLGTIVVSIDKIKEKAQEFGHTQEDELSLLFIHGLLHLLGYDHEKDEGQMREKEAEIIKGFDLPNSLILRNS